MPGTVLYHAANQYMCFSLSLLCLRFFVASSRSPSLSARASACMHVVRQASVTSVLACQGLLAPLGMWSALISTPTLETWHVMRVAPTRSNSHAPPPAKHGHQMESYLGKFGDLAHFLHLCSVAPLH